MVVSRVLTVAEWNDLLGRINALATDPPAGCDTLSELPLVESPHIWTTADITAARDKLIEICADNTFEAPAEGKWLLAIIDELDAAISAGWCECEGGTPCEEPVIHSVSGPVESVGGETWVYALIRYWLWYDENHNGQVDPGEIEETCAQNPWYVRKGSILHAYPSINGFQVYPDFYVAEVGASYPTNIRTFEFVRTRLPFSHSDLCAPMDYPDIGLVSGVLQPDGRVMFLGDPDPEIGMGQLVLQVRSGMGSEHPYIPWPGGYELRGYCVQVGLDNFRIPVGSPAGTVVGRITCSDDRFTATLYPNWDLEQVGDEVRTKRDFNWPEDVWFSLSVTGPGLSYPWTNSFTLKVR